MVLPSLIRSFISQVSIDTVLVPETMRDSENTHDWQTTMQLLPLLGSQEANSKTEIRKHELH
jgi:hypothetical protein